MEAKVMTYDPKLQIYEYKGGDSIENMFSMVRFCEKAGLVHDYIILKEGENDAKDNLENQ